MRALHTIDILRGRAVAALFLAAVTLAPTLVSAQASGGRRRSSCVNCEAEVRREKALERLDSLQWQFEHERLTDREREQLKREITLAVRELQAAIGDLRVQMGDLERARAGAWATAPRVAYTYSTMPHGYLGVSFDGPNTEDFRGNERIIRFLTYPKISLVEPSSPAERAGIRVGDTLIAMNGIDVLEREISLTRVLVPDEALLVKLRRDGSAREFKVTVGRAPPYVAMRVMTPAAPMPAEPAPGVARVRTPMPRTSVSPAPRAPVAAVPSVWVYSDGIAGAKVETVTEGLGKALGVRGGVVVFRAGPGTPANESGLRDGDVIVRVAGTRVRSVRELRAQLERHDHGDGVKLVIVRDRKEREVTLKQ